MAGTGNLAEIINEQQEKNSEENDTPGMSEPQENEVKAESEQLGADSMDHKLEIEKLMIKLKTMEDALQGAARLSQSKADEIANLTNENEHLRAVNDDLKMKSKHDAEIQSLREREAILESQVYALTKEMNALRSEQSRTSNAAALLDEKDEILNQVIAEGEELSKKLDAQGSTIRKLREQIGELEEEKAVLTTKLLVEENKGQSAWKDKVGAEKLLQETLEKHPKEIAAQKEYYIHSLEKANEALAEKRANHEAITELRSLLRKTEQRELEREQERAALRQILSRTKQQAASREEIFDKNVQAVKTRYQLIERYTIRMITQARQLQMQIEAMQAISDTRDEAWAAVERSVNSRIQEEETKAAVSEEREPYLNELLSQTLSKIEVLENELRFNRCVETALHLEAHQEWVNAFDFENAHHILKEKAKYQAEANTQLEEELKDLRLKNKQELQDAEARNKLLEQEVEKLKAARLDLERTCRAHFAATMNPRFESALGQREGEIASIMSRLASLEDIRNSVALEVVEMTEKFEKLRAESDLLPQMREELEQPRQTHFDTLEQIGERDEELEELCEIKEMYRKQLN